MKNANIMLLNLGSRIRSDFYDENIILWFKTFKKMTAEKIHEKDK